MSAPIPPPLPVPTGQAVVDPPRRTNPRVVGTPADRSRGRRQSLRPRRRRPGFASGARDRCRADVDSHPRGAARAGCPPWRDELDRAREAGPDELADTWDSLAPDARIMVQADVLRGRRLRRVVRDQRRDRRSWAQRGDADSGFVRLGRTAGDVTRAPDVSPRPSTRELHRRHEDTRSDRGLDLGTPEARAALDLAVSELPRPPARRSWCVARSMTEWRAGLRTEQIALEGNAVTERQPPGLSQQSERRAQTDDPRHDVLTNPKATERHDDDVLAELCVSRTTATAWRHPPCPRRHFASRARAEPAAGTRSTRPSDNRSGRGRSDRYRLCAPLGSVEPPTVGAIEPVTNDVGLGPSMAMAEACVAPR